MQRLWLYKKGWKHANFVPLMQPVFFHKVSAPPHPILEWLPHHKQVHNPSVILLRQSIRMGETNRLPKAHTAAVTKRYHRVSDDSIHVLKYDGIFSHPLLYPSLNKRHFSQKIHTDMAILAG